MTDESTVEGGDSQGTNVDQGGDTSIVPAAPAGEGTKVMTFHDLNESDTDIAPPAKPKKPTKAADAETGEEEEDDEDLDLDLDDEGDLDADDEGTDDADADLDGEEDAESDESEETSDQEAAASDKYDNEKIRVKVDGKWKEYTGKQMKDLVSSGDHLRDRRHAFESEVQEHKKEFDGVMQKLQKTNEILKPTDDALAKGDIEAAIINLGGFRDLNKLQMRRMLTKQMIPRVANLLGLNKQQVDEMLQKNSSNIRSIELSEENEFYKEQQEKQSTATTSKDDDPETQMKSFQLEMGISEDYLRRNIKWLTENTYKGKADQITFDVLRKSVKLHQAVDKAFDAIEAVSPKLRGDRELVDRTTTLVRKRPDLTIGQVAKWVRKQHKLKLETTRNKEETELKKDLSRKVQKSNNQAALKKASPGSQKKAMRFDDLGGDGAFE